LDKASEKQLSLLVRGLEESEAFEQGTGSALAAPLEPCLPRGEKIEVKKPSNYIPWAELLKRNFRFALEVCPSCGAKLWVIAAVMSNDAIEKILTHLHLPTDRPQGRRSIRTEYTYDSGE